MARRGTGTRPKAGLVLLLASVVLLGVCILQQQPPAPRRALVVARETAVAASSPPGTRNVARTRTPPAGGRRRGCGADRAAPDERAACGALPIADVHPPECWPRVVLLASFPTSGNGMLRDLWEAATGVVSLSTYKMPGRNTGELPRTMWARTSSGLLLYRKTEAVLDPCAPGGLELPAPGVGAALAKTHYSGMNRKNNEQRYASENIFGGLAGVARLARNPGDNLLRNKSRWASPGNVRSERTQRAACGGLEAEAAKWNAFHDLWNAYNASVPQAIFRYETATDPALAAGELRRLIAFAGGTGEREEGAAERAVREIVRAPSYAHGTLLRDTCGEGVARRVHELTRETSAALGYVFDDASATWSVAPGAR